MSTAPDDHCMGRDERDWAERMLVFGEPGAERVGVLSEPNGTGVAGLPVIIVVGGPQTRVGSHRQFVTMARRLAAAGHPCLRFDLSGMGDSPGPRPDFEKAGPDLKRAVDTLAAALPTFDGAALWGLCDGASAAILNAQADARIVTVIAANPWARSDATRSAALVSSHYGGRLRSPAFWKKLVTGRIDLFGSAREALGHLLRARKQASPQARGELPDRLAGALGALQGRVRLQLSGRDLTAAEFEIAMTRAGLADCLAAAWRLAQADHTFSDPAHWEAVIDDTLAWLARVAPIVR